MFIQDIVDPDNDQLIANFVVESHSKSRPAAGASVSSTATPADPRASDDNSSTATPADPEVVSAQPTCRFTLLPQYLLRDFQLSSADTSTRSAEEIYNIR